jgi:chromosome segregation ATPase
VLYLAEVQKKTKLLGSSKADLKLLAQQRAEDRWQVLANGEVLSSEKANDFNAGVLVLVDVSDKSGQVQRVSDAASLILKNFQNFSRLMDKLKDNEEEIEQWRQSLTYQSQELNRREMEMEARREQMQQLEEEMAQLERDKKDALALRDSAQQLREELDRRDRELREAQKRLESERSGLESRKQEIQNSAVVNSDQVGQVQEALNRFSEVVIPTDVVRAQLNQVLELLNGHKSTLAEHWGQLDQHQAQAYQLQENVNQQAQTLRERWEVWHQAQTELAQAKSELAAQQQILTSQQEHRQTLCQQIAHQETLRQQMAFLAGGVDPEIAQQVDLEALDTMSLSELESRVQEVQKDYEKTFNFVNDQEEELRFRIEDIEAKKEQINQASEYDRLTLENELADLQSDYQVFNESVVPQRKRLQEAKSVLAIYQKALNRRKGHNVDESGQPTLDLTPVLAEIDTQCQSYEEALQHLEDRIQRGQESCQQATGAVARGEDYQQQQRQELQHLEDELLNQHAVVAELWGKVKTYQELLQPTQDLLNGLDERLQTTNQELNRVQEVGDYQLQLLAEIKQSLAALTSG